MKRILILGTLLLCLTGCNKQIFDFQYEFDKAVCNYDGEKFELKIDKWTDYEGEQIQIISNTKVYLLTTNKCYLVKEVDND